MSMIEYPHKGKFCRKLREIHAIRVSRDNEEQLQQFVVGGHLSKVGQDDQVMFFFDNPYVTCQGWAREGEWIVTEDGVNFEVMTDEHFRSEYEPN